MKQELEAAIATAVKELFRADMAVELTRPDEQFGDYATNVALQLGQKLGKNPRELGEALAVKLRETLKAKVNEISVAGPGFLNIKLNDQSLLKSLDAQPAKTLSGQTVVAEYSDPNPFKILHAGHLYTSIVGDAIANLCEQAGAEVHRVNFGGDVGRHVAITMWAILHELGGEHPEKLTGVPTDQHADWMSARYVQGNAAFEDDEQVKTEVVELNKRLYQLVEAGDHESPLAQIYWTCRKWSYEYFDKFYASIGSKFEKYYPESETIKPGLAAVKENIGKIFEVSEGAVVFKGEVHNMHTRVFINSQGLPTYETKEVGLILKKWQDYHFDRSIIITGNEIYDYMQVVLKALEQFAAELVRKTTHITHGLVRLAGGIKMSSRKGNIIRAVDVLNAASEANKSVSGQDSNQIMLGAVKYAFLKQRIGGDIIYDPKESVSLEGNSGPYLQYAHARARSILSKAESGQGRVDGGELETGERSLARKISEYAEVVDKAVAELMPHHICTYLYELAQQFNSFYEHNRVIGDPREALRLGLVGHYADTLKNGLSLLGITAPERL